MVKYIKQGPRNARSQTHFHPHTTEERERVYVNKIERERKSICEQEKEEMATRKRERGFVNKREREREREREFNVCRMVLPSRRISNLKRDSKCVCVFI